MTKNKKVLYAHDFKFGLNNEIGVLNKLKDISNTIYKTTNDFNKFDFRDDENKIDIELKSRRIKYGQYPTIFFGKPKLLHGRQKRKDKESNRTIYCFEFINKDIYYWEDIGNDEDFKIKMCGNYRNNEKAKPLVDLDIRKLKPLSELVI